MRRLLAIGVAALLAMQGLATGSPSKTSTYSVVLAGGVEANVISIQLSPDGRAFVIDSRVPLEVGGSICTNPPEMPTELVCQATSVANFEVNAGPGDDSVTVGKSVPIPVTLRGGAGNDKLAGGAGPDKLIGGPGQDRLVGRNGDDLLMGGEGEDSLFGGAGDDVLRGGLGADALFGGGGRNELRQ